MFNGLGRFIALVFVAGMLVVGAVFGIVELLSDNEIRLKEPLEMKIEINTKDVMENGKITTVSDTTYIYELP